MAIDLKTLREEIKPHEETLLKERVESKPEKVGDMLVGLLKEVEQRNTVKSNAGRPQKIKGQELKSRHAVLLTKEQKEIIERRRGAGGLNPMDASSFLREYLERTGLFNTEKNPVLESPTVYLEHLSKSHQK